MRGLVEPRHEETSDAQLIDRFVNQRDESAFATLVRRHGPMVLAVCQRVLMDSHDAEDAFQATFLVFARKANSLTRRERVASWLYGVAYRIARKARVVSVSRRSVQMDFRDVPGPEQVQDLAWRELQLVLDEEVEHLPAKYRDPIVLCYLKGLTYAAAALSLGVPAGTVAGRLDRAREMLRCRLTRRGLALSAGLLGTLLTQHTASAAVAPSMVQATVVAGLAFVGQAAGPVSGQALFLANATLRSLFYTKCKVAAGVLLSSAALLGGGFWSQQYLASRGAGQPQADRIDAPQRFLPGNPLPPQPATEATQVVERAIRALGGREKVATLKSASWTIIWDPGTPTERKHRITARGYDQFRKEMEYRKNGKVESSLYILNKDVGWRRDADGGVVSLPPAMLATNKEHNYALRLGDLLPFLAEAQASLTLTGEATIDQWTVTGLRVERPDYPAVQLFFEKASGLLLRSETQLSPRPDGTRSTLVYQFEEYRACDGLQRYTRLITRLDDQPDAVGHIRDYQILDPEDDRPFDKP